MCPKRSIKALQFWCSELYTQPSFSGQHVEHIRSKMSTSKFGKSKKWNNHCEVVELLSSKVSNAPTMRSRACCNKSKAKGTYNLFFHGLRERLGPSTWHTASSAVKPWPMMSQGQAAAVLRFLPPKQWNSTTNGRGSDHKRRKDHSWKHILNQVCRHTLACCALSVAVLGATSSSEYLYCCAACSTKYQSQSSGAPLTRISDNWSMDTTVVAHKCFLFCLNCMHISGCQCKSVPWTSRKDSKHLMAKLICHSRHIPHPASVYPVQSKDLRVCGSSEQYFPIELPL